MGKQFRRARHAVADAWVDYALPLLALLPIFGSQFNLRRAGIAAGFVSVIVPLVFAIYEIQQWKMPSVLAVPLVALMLATIAVASGVVIREMVRAFIKAWEYRTTSATWVLKEPPGLLDYEVEGLRAINRFTKELDGLRRDTENLGKALRQQTEESRNPDPFLNPRRRQRRADAAARAFDRSASYIERRADLLNALVMDSIRNYEGLIGRTDFQTDEDRIAAQQLAETLDQNSVIGASTLQQTRDYRAAMVGVRDQNISRTVRMASNHLVGALDDAIKVLDANQKGLQRLARQLRQKLGSASRR